MPGLSRQITPFDPALVRESGNLWCRTKIRNKPPYYLNFPVDILSEDDDYYYASPKDLFWQQPKDVLGTKYRYGFIPYPKYAWKLV